MFQQKKDGRVTEAFIEAHNLVKTYQAGKNTVTALDDLSLSVPKGSVQALLGPNGAGKTTTVKVLTTLIEPDSGSAHIDGVDVVANPEAIRRMIGVSGQYAAVDENLTGFENLDMVGRLYHLSPAASRAREILQKHAQGDVTISADDRTLVGPVENAAKTLQVVLKDLADAGIELNDAGMRRPTLDDVFLQLTGHTAEEVSA